MKKAAWLIIGILLLASTSFAANGNLTVDGVVHSGGNHYNVLSYDFSGTPTNGIKIRTNIPYTSGIGLPTVIIEGYAFGLRTPISLAVSWYVYNGNFDYYGASSSGTYSPVIKLAKETRAEGDFVVIYIDDRQYYSRFSIRAYAKGRSEQDSWFEGWSAADQALTTETNVVTVPYRTVNVPKLAITSAAAGTTAAPLYPTIDFLGYQNSNKARIRTTEESTDTQGSKFSILVNDGAGVTSLVERLTINKDGNVGIGTTSPKAQLEVAGTGGRRVKVIGNTGQIQIEGDGLNYATGLKFTSGGATNTNLTGIWALGSGTNLTWLALGESYNNATMYVRNGSVAIGTQADPGTNKLYVAGPAYSTGGWLPSDVRFKKNFEDIDSPLGKVLNLRGLSYEWKTDEYRDKGFLEGRHYGVIAQEIEKVLPDVVNTAPDGSKAVAYTEIIPVLIEAIKEQQKRIEALERKLAALH